MRWMWRRALRSLLVAGSLGVGLAGRPCMADDILPPIGEDPPKSALPPRRPMKTILPVSTEAEMPLPRVVEPAAPAPTTAPAAPAPLPRGLPIAKPGPAARPTGARLSRVPFAADQGGTIDLLAVPHVPSSWALDTVVPPAPRATPAEGKPVVAAMASMSATKDVPLKPELLNPATSANATTDVAVKPEPVTLAPTTPQLAPIPDQKTWKKGLPKVEWAGNQTETPVTDSWPAAFVEHGTDTKAASAEPTPAAPLGTAALHKKVALACGGLAREVKVVALPDHGFHVSVRAMNSESERELVQRLQKMPEWSSPNLRIELELLP